MKRVHAMDFFCVKFNYTSILAGVYIFCKNTCPWVLPEQHSSSRAVLQSTHLWHCCVFTSFCHVHCCDPRRVGPRLLFFPLIFVHSWAAAAWMLACERTYARVLICTTTAVGCLYALAKYPMFFKGPLSKECNSMYVWYYMYFLSMCEYGCMYVATEYSSTTSTSMYACTCSSTTIYIYILTWLCDLCVTVIVVHTVDIKNYRPYTYSLLSECHKSIAVVQNVPPLGFLFVLFSSHNYRVPFSFCWSAVHSVFHG